MAIKDKKGLKASGAPTLFALDAGLMKPRRGSTWSWAKLGVGRISLFDLTSTRKLWYVISEIDSRSGGSKPKGNLVKFGDGHAAVIGYETCHIHYPSTGSGWEGARRPEA